MTGRIGCIVLALFPIVLHFVSSCQTISRVSWREERSQAVKVLPACNQPSSQNSQGWIGGHDTCYGQTNRSISFTEAYGTRKPNTNRHHIERWEDIWENLPALLWLRCSGSWLWQVTCSGWLCCCPLVTYLALSPPAAALATIMPLSLSLKGTILPLNTKFYHKKYTRIDTTWRGVATCCISNQSPDQVIYVCCSSGILLFVTSLPAQPMDTRQVRYIAS